MSKKHQQLIEHLKRFNNGRTITDSHIDEYLDYQSKGGAVPKDNPLLDCQKWKEWTLGQMVEESFEWWCDNAGWVYPILAEAENYGAKIKGGIEAEGSKDPIMVRAIKKIYDGIKKRGMVDFYMSHPATNKDKTRIDRMIEKKFAA